MGWPGNVSGGILSSPAIWEGKAITESAGAWRSLGIPVLLTLLVALAALACNYPEPTQPHPLQNLLQHHSKRSTSRA